MEFKENKVYLTEREIQQTGFESPIEITSQTLQNMDESIRTDEQECQSHLSDCDVLSRSDQICHDFRRARIHARRQVYSQISSYAVELFAGSLQEVECLDDFLKSTR